ncbi:MAG: hypothetical protein EBY61_01450 [Actinobacteria bacterium]|nr:hypothetical protein [Actinomycetota bacterium]
MDPFPTAGQLHAPQGDQASPRHGGLRSCGGDRGAPDARVAAGTLAVLRARDERVARGGRGRANRGRGGGRARTGRFAGRRRGRRRDRIGESDGRRARRGERHRPRVRR